jgi:hypothetical protein
MRTKQQSLQTGRDRRPSSRENLALVAGGCHPSGCTWVVSGTATPGAQPTPQQPTPTQPLPAPAQPQQPAGGSAWSLHVQIGGPTPMPGLDVTFHWLG